MIRPILLAAAMALLLVPSAPGQVAPRPGPAASDDEVYRAAKSAIAEARNRAAGRDLSTRKRALAGATESAMKATAARFAITRERLDKIVEAGRIADGTAAKDAAASAKAAARANVQGQLNALSPPPARAGLPPGLSTSDARSVMRALGQGPPATPPGTPTQAEAPAPGPEASGLTAGARVILARPGGAGHAHFATDRAAYRELQSALTSGDLKTFSALGDSGKVLRIANGTRAEVLEVAEGSRRVRLLDGDRAGTQGWVDASYLTVP